ncbi:hypothetical protein H101_05935 [Trichophyton interdigitale H6]|nr:hypothetical protein H101_05935 [Trichophyton interdigitale H6]
MPFEMKPRFCFVAPRLRQQFFWWASLENKGHTLDELLFEVPTYELVTHLARPVFPSSLVEASAQSFRPDVQGRTSIPQKWRRESATAFEPSTSHAPVRTRSTQADLAGLPVEIHYIIFESLSLQELYRLGLTCHCLWAVMMPVLARRCMESLGTWAGTPVICTSDLDTLGGDNPYPPTLLQPEDLEELDEGLDAGELPDEIDGCYAWSPVNLFELAGARYDHPRDFRAYAISELFFGNRTEDPKRLAHISIFLRAPTFYPTDRQWVLRNLTTREFVRPAAVALDKAYIRGPFIDVIGFGEVILSRTVWYDDLPSDVRDDDLSSYIRDDSWAGHCLDIVPITDLDEGGPWNDISDQVSQHIERIGKHKFGDNWRTHIQERARRQNGPGCLKYQRWIP